MGATEISQQGPVSGTPGSRGRQGSMPSNTQRSHTHVLHPTVKSHSLQSPQPIGLPPPPRAATRQTVANKPRERKEGNTEGCRAAGQKQMHSQGQQARVVL